MASRSCRTTVATIMFAVALAAFHAITLARPAEAQVLKKLEEAARKADEKLRKAAEALGTVRCAAADTTCIEKARAEHKPVVLTGEDGKVLTDENGQPVAGPDQPPTASEATRTSSAPAAMTGPLAAPADGEYTARMSPRIWREEHGLHIVDHIEPSLTYSGRAFVLVREATQGANRITLQGIVLCPGDNAEMGGATVTLVSWPESRIPLDTRKDDAFHWVPNVTTPSAGPFRGYLVLTSDDGKIIAGSMHLEGKPTGGLQPEAGRSVPERVVFKADFRARRVVQNQAGRAEVLLLRLCQS